MGTLPPAISNYMSSMLMAEKSAIFFLMDDGGTIQEAGGALSVYGIDAPPIGKNIKEIFIFMEGILPLDEPILRLPKVNLASTKTVEAHVFKNDAGYGLLLLDNTCYEQEIASLQQRSNELALFREKHTTLIEKSLCSDTGKKLSALDLFHSSNRIQGSILCAGIRGFSNYADTLDTSKLFLALKDFLSAIVDPIHRQGGILDGVSANYVLAIFGVFPFSCPAPVQSLEAIQLIFNNIESIKNNPRYQETSAIDIGIGVATGVVSIIADKAHPHQPMFAIGNCIKTAFQLERNTPRGRVMIDLPTYNSAGSYHSLFKKVKRDAFVDVTQIPRAFIGNFYNV